MAMSSKGITYVDGLPVEEVWAEALKKNLESIKRFQIREGDIFLVTFPRCGTTWMQYIIWGILNKGAKPPDVNEMMFNNIFPYLEVTGTQIAESMPSPRPLKSHLPRHLVPRDPRARYIYVVRNPFDCCISYYHFALSTTKEGLAKDYALTEFFEDFIQGRVEYGDYFDHVLGWYESGAEENVLIVSYEGMAKDHRRTVLKVARFLGELYYQEILEKGTILERIVQHSSFSFMESLLTFRLPRNLEIAQTMDLTDRNVWDDDDKFYSALFFRKGQVGDFQAALTAEQKDRLRKRMEGKFYSTNILSYWTDLL